MPHAATLSERLLCFCLQQPLPLLLLLLAIAVPPLPQYTPTDHQYIKPTRATSSSMHPFILSTSIISTPSLGQLWAESATNSLTTPPWGATHTFQLCLRSSLPRLLVRRRGAALPAPSCTTGMMDATNVFQSLHSDPSLINFI